MLARFRCQDGTITDWSDVTTKRVTAVQRTRFFPPRNSRLVSNGSILLTTNDPLAERLRAARTNSRSRSRAVTTPTSSWRSAR